jgi:aerobic-type carbon monoxide dehydrogenase small subunit (CoxS/CutS family)
MGKELKLTINKEFYELTIKPNTLLLDVLRRELKLTGTKTGCQTGSRDYDD